MKRPLVVTALLSSCATSVAFWAMGMQTPNSTVKLEKERVGISEVVYRPGVPRERYIRPTDQVIVFLEESRYERTDSQMRQDSLSHARN